MYVLHANGIARQMYHNNNRRFVVLLCDGSEIQQYKFYCVVLVAAVVPFLFVFVFVLLAFDSSYSVVIMFVVI